MTDGPFTSPALEDLAPWLLAVKESAIERERKSRGLPDDVQCLMCGDTGMYPGTDTPHPYCDAGQRVLAEREQAAAARNVTLLDRASGIPSRFAEYTLTTCPEQKAAKVVRSWVDAEPWQSGQNLIVAGPVGCGKTGLAIGAMRAVWEHRTITQRFAPVSRLLDDLRPGNESTAGDLLDMMLNRPVVCLDDLGSEKRSDWTDETLFRIVDERYTNQRPTIVTTNVPFSEMAERIEPRIVSRLLESAVRVIPGTKDLRTRLEAPGRKKITTIESRHQ